MGGMYPDTVMGKYSTLIDEFRAGWISGSLRFRTEISWIQEGDPEEKLCACFQHGPDQLTQSAQDLEPSIKRKVSAGLALTAPQGDSGSDNADLPDCMKAVTTIDEYTRCLATSFGN